jgi:hypothetical protein
MELAFYYELVNGRAKVLQAKERTVYVFDDGSFIPLIDVTFGPSKTVTFPHILTVPTLKDIIRTTFSKNDLKSYPIVNPSLFFGSSRDYFVYLLRGTKLRPNHDWQVEALQTHYQEILSRVLLVNPSNL